MFNIFYTDASGREKKSRVIALKYQAVSPLVNHAMRKMNALNRRSEGVIYVDLFQPIQGLNTLPASLSIKVFEQTVNKYIYIAQWSILYAGMASA